MTRVRLGPLLLAAAGAVLIWSAVHGANISSSVRDLLAHRGP
jgi:hypothetical protein